MKPVILIALLLVSCSQPTEEANWLANQQLKCGAMGGSGFYDDGTKEYSCYKYKVGPFYELLFSERFQ